MTSFSVSVVTVCYNEIDCIARCVESVLGQHYEDIQYLVIDGGSRDGTAELLRGYGNKIDCLISERDDGIYSAMNKALPICRGEIVYFLNADDYFFSDTVVGDAVKLFCKHPETDILSGRVRFFNTPVHNGKPYTRDNFAYSDRLELYRNPIPQQCLFARRRLFEDYDNFDERYTICADYDWLVRMLGNDIIVRHVEDYFCNFDYTGISCTQSARRKREKNRIVLRNSSALELVQYGIRGLTANLEKLSGVR